MFNWYRKRRESKNSIIMEEDDFQKELNEMNERHRKAALDALVADKEQMTKSPCPMRNGDLCSDDCVNFKEGEVYIGTYIQYSRCRCRLWNKL